MITHKYHAMNYKHLNVYVFGMYYYENFSKINEKYMHFSTLFNYNSYVAISRMILLFKMFVSLHKNVKYNLEAFLTCNF